MATLPPELADDPELLVYEATGPGDVSRIRREVEGRVWASRNGIPTAETVGCDPEGRWLVSRRVVECARESTEYVAAALAMSQQIQGLPHPCFASAGRTWRAPRRSAPLRLARLLRAGVDPREFLAARRAFEALPREATVHNDYHRENVLNTSQAGHVTVIDWEYTAVGPRHQDMVRLICDLRDGDLARSAWDLLVDSVPVSDRPMLSVQLRWLTLRVLATEVTVTPQDVDPVKCARRRARQLEAEEWATELDASNERNT